MMIVEEEEQETLGHHALLELYSCTPSQLNDSGFLERLLLNVASQLKCTVLGQRFHTFEPVGVSGIVLLAESHLSIHTWPEHGYAAVDLFTCGDPQHLSSMPALFQNKLQSSHHDFQIIKRGQPNKASDVGFERVRDRRLADSIELDKPGLNRKKTWLSDGWSENILWSARIKKVIAEEHTCYQDVLILDTHQLGRVLVLDGNIQCSEADEKSYHEMMVHTLMCRAGASNTPKKVLVIGGGDGGCARELLRYPYVTKVDMVDIDRELVELCEKHLPKIFRRPDNQSSLRDDKRFNLIIDDGAEYLKTCEDYYDAIFVDATDPIGPGASLYSHEFYRSTKSRLNPNGALAVQGGSTWYFRDTFRQVYQNLQALFPVVHPLECFSAVYPGGVWSIQIATMGDDPRDVNDKLSRLHDDLDWYSSERHQAAFILPPHAQELLY